MGGATKHPVRRRRPNCPHLRRRWCAPLVCICDGAGVPCCNCMYDAIFGVACGPCMASAMAHMLASAMVPLVLMASAMASAMVPLVRMALAMALVPRGPVMILVTRSSNVHACSATLRANMV